METFPPPLEMVASVSAWGYKQFAVSTIKNRAVHQSLVETKYRSKRRGAPRFETIVVRALPFDDIVPQNQLQGKAVDGAL